MSEPPDTAGVIRNRLLRLLAREHGNVLNVTRLAAAIATDRKRTEAHLDRLERDGRIRRLWPCPSGRATSAPKVYIRNRDRFCERRGTKKDWAGGLPGTVLGAKWEGLVVGRLLDAAPSATHACFYRDRGGHEMDLVLDFPDCRGRWAIEIKLKASTRLRKSFHRARAALEPDRCWFVHRGTRRFQVLEGVEAIGLDELARLAGENPADPASEAGHG